MFSELAKVFAVKTNSANEKIIAGINFFITKYYIPSLGSEITAAGEVCTGSLTLSRLTSL